MPNYNQLSQEQWAQKEKEKVREMRWQNACKLAARTANDIQDEDTLQAEAELWFRILTNPPWEQNKFENGPEFAVPTDLNTRETSILEITSRFTMESEWLRQITEFSKEQWFGAEEHEFYNEQWRKWASTPTAGF